MLFGVLFGAAPLGAVPLGAVPLGGGSVVAALDPPRWSWPVGPPHGILRPYEAPPTRYAAGHRGIDVGASVGSEVRAPAAGVVSFAGRVVDRPVISITHPDGVISSVEPVAALVARGEDVAEGAVIGTLTDEGAHCRAGPCLHLGVRVSGEYVSPLLFLGEIPHSVLLPLGTDSVFDE